MNNYFQFQKDTRNIIGLMSGTSLDGLDIALCSISGNGLQTEINLKQFITIPYDDEFRNELESISSKKPSTFNNYVS